MITLRRAVPAGLVLALSACAPLVPGPSPEDLLARIEAASTRSDHEALAAHYDGAAASMGASALEHRKMAGESFGPGRGSWTRPAHCRTLARSYDAHATEYRAMAVAQRQLAALAR